MTLKLVMALVSPLLSESVLEPSLELGDANK